jgi:large subunit ribosomal protein L15
MQIHELSPRHKRKKSKRIGRGGKKGTYSGKGMKGQKSRAGRKFKPAIRSIIKRYPKLRGYAFNPVSTKPSIITFEILEKVFSKGDIINPNILVEKKLVARIKGKTPKVKVLATGELTKALIFENCIISKKAKEIIEKSGGSVK